MAVASFAPSSSNSAPSMKTTDLPRWTTRASATSLPGYVGRRKLTFSSSVGTAKPGPSSDSAAGPIVSSSIAVTKPPWMTPTGFSNCSPGRNSNRTLPGSACSGRIPSNLA